MTKERPRGAVAAAVVVALLVVFVFLPALVSLGDQDGAVCLTASACPLSALNPCVRKPSFAVVGRCAWVVR
jgi:hypothetical protein